MTKTTTKTKTKEARRDAENAADEQRAQREDWACGACGHKRYHLWEGHAATYRVCNRCRMNGGIVADPPKAVR